MREPLTKTGRFLICWEKALYSQFIQGYVPRPSKGGDRFKEAQLASGAAIDEIQDRRDLTIDVAESPVSRNSGIRENLFQQLARALIGRTGCNLLMEMPDEPTGDLCPVDCATLINLAGTNVWSAA